jgi:GNAT superfamily N-acetyltransferase
MASVFTCGPRRFRSGEEFRRWFEIRAQGFGPWYVDPPRRWSLRNNRRVRNCHAALFAGFYHELRTADGRAVGYLSTVPGWWSGDVQSLHDFAYLQETLEIGAAKLLAITAVHLVLAEWLRMPGLFERLAARLRRRRLGGANAVFLDGITLDPAYRHHHLPQRLLDQAKESARRLGYAYVAAPFRPNRYGAYKAERQAAHSDALFVEYCTARNPEGLPIDPWLRTVVRNGARLLRAAPRSLVIKGSMAKFERLRQTFRPGDWYSPAPDVWECGESCTWYVDRARRLVASVESNWWGVIDLREGAREPRPAERAVAVAVP